MNSPALDDGYGGGVDDVSNIALRGWGGLFSFNYDRRNLVEQWAFRDCRVGFRGGWSGGNLHDEWDYFPNHPGVKKVTNSNSYVDLEGKGLDVKYF